MTKKLKPSVLQVFVFSAALILAVKISWPSLLKLYVKLGMGDCSTLPILCNRPAMQINDFISNPTYTDGLQIYKLPDMSIKAPKEFVIVKENVKKIYYKRRIQKETNQIIYIVYEKPNFFLRLFPELTKKGVAGDYDFLSRVMNAQEESISNLDDAFFVIMKGIFIPDLGNQLSVKMAKLNSSSIRGFVNYNITNSGNYFDLNIINSKNEFFKVYIKDKKSSLDLDKALNIISTIQT